MKSKTEGEEIAVMQAQMVDIQKDISEIKTDIRSILANLAATGTQNAILNKEISDLKVNFQKDLDILRRQSILWKWLSPTLSSAITAIIVFLVLNYLEKL